MMRDLVNTHDFHFLSTDEAVEILSRHEESSPFSPIMMEMGIVRIQTSLPGALRSIPAKMKKIGYVMGRTSVVDMKSECREEYRLYYWQREDANYPGPGLGCPPVEEDEAHMLIPQAYIILSSFEAGVESRSREVKGHLAGLLGVSSHDVDAISRLSDSI